MTKGKGKVLNLDELYGTADPVLVVFGDKTYELVRPSAWTPETYQKYVSLQKTITAEEVESATEDPKKFAKLSEVLKKILQIISPDLAKLDLSMEMQGMVVQHYAKTVFPAEHADAEKKIAAKNRIGA